MARDWLAHNNLLGFPYRYGFTPSSLTRMVRRLGFDVIHVTGDVLVPVADEYTRPWARMEERVVKWLGRVVSWRSTRDRPLAPWFELYCRAV